MTSYTANIIAKGEARGEARGKAIGETISEAVVALKKLSDDELC